MSWIRKFRQAPTSFLALFLFASACSRSVGRADLIGTYRANHGHGTDILRVNEDGTYLHSFQSVNGDQQVNQDRWELEIVQGNPRLVFHKFVFALPEYGDKQRGMWPVEPEPTLGKVRLVF